MAEGQEAQPGRLLPPEPGRRPPARMVFESLVVDVLNRFLGDYVVNLDSSQLKLGIWGGTKWGEPAALGSRPPARPPPPPSAPWRRFPSARPARGRPAVRAREEAGAVSLGRPAEPGRAAPAAALGCLPGSPTRRSTCPAA